MKKPIALQLPVSLVLLSGVAFIWTGQLPAYAQGGGAVSAGQGATSVEPAPAAQGPAAATRKFLGEVTAGTSLESGRTDLRGVQIDFQGRRPYNHGEFETSTIFTYAKTRPQGFTQRFTAANRLFATASFDYLFGKIPIFMTETIFLRDKLARIDHRVEQMAGFGVNLANDRVRFRFVPGVSILKHDRERTVNENFDVYWGAFQDLNVKLTPTWSFTQYFLGKRDISDAHDFILDGRAAITGMINRTLGIQIAYYYSHEDLLPPGISPRYAKLTAGLNLKFSR